MWRRARAVPRALESLMANALKHKTASGKPAVAGVIAGPQWDEEHLFAGGAADGDPLVWDPTATDKVRFGGDLHVSGVALIGVSAAFGASAGEALIGNAKSYRGLNAAGNTATQLIGIDASDRVVVCSGSNNLRLATSGGAVLTGSATVTAGAAAGDIILPNARSFSALNAGASAAIQLVGLGATNIMILGNGSIDIEWNKPNVAMGGGAAPTVGTIGGSGPAAAAQRNWLRFIESDGTASFIPVWR
jgi:hypothetical protein